MTNRKIYCLLSIISLGLGTAIYICFRENSYIGIISGNFYIIDLVQNLTASLSWKFIQYYLPDFLWGFSLGCGLLAIYTPKKAGGFICSGIAFASGCIWELLQYTDIINGTGDFLDILMYLSASAMCTTINILRSRKL